MANFTTKTLLSSPDELLGMPGDGQFISFLEPSGSDRSLDVLDVNSGQRFLIDTFSATSNGLSVTGIGGGTLSSNGQQPRNPGHAPAGDRSALVSFLHRLNE
jgi:hypothetical protein